MHGTVEPLAAALRWTSWSNRLWNTIYEEWQKQAIDAGYENVSWNVPELSRRNLLPHPGDGMSIGSLNGGYWDLHVRVNKLDGRLGVVLLNSFRDLSSVTVSSLDREFNIFVIVHNLRAWMSSSNENKIRHRWRDRAWGAMDVSS